MNLLEFQEQFPNEEACEAYLIRMRWPEGFACGNCQGKSAWYIQSRRSFQCSFCDHQESITANTMFHRTRTPLREWFLAIYLICESKKGISALELAHHLGMRDERRAIRLKERIQQAMTERNQRYLLQEFVEMDEAFMGGKGNKTPVLVGVSVDENDAPKFVRFQVLPDLKANSIESAAKTLISPSADVVSDGHRSHNHLDTYFNEHIQCIQREPKDSKEYLPWVHILISNAKRFLGGTHHSVKHLQGYLEEFSWRFNRRFGNLFDRMLVSATHFKPAYLH